MKYKVLRNNHQYKITYICDMYTESEQVCEFNAAVPLGITETKRKMLRIFFKFQYNLYDNQ